MIPSALRELLLSSFHPRAARQICRNFSSTSCEQFVVMTEIEALWGENWPAKAAAENWETELGLKPVIVRVVCGVK